MNRIENEAIAGTLFVTVCEILQANADERHRIAIARLEARALMSVMKSDGAKAHERVRECFGRLNSLAGAQDKAAAAWMLAAIQERLAEGGLPNWKELLQLAKEAERLLLQAPGSMLQ